MDVTLIETEKLKKYMKGYILWDIANKYHIKDLAAKSVINAAMEKMYEDLECDLEWFSLDDLIDLWFDKEYSSFDLEETLAEVGVTL